MMDNVTMRICQVESALHTYLQLYAGGETSLTDPDILAWVAGIALLGIPQEADLPQMTACFLTAHQQCQMAIDANMSKAMVCTDGYWHLVTQ